MKKLYVSIAFTFFIAAVGLPEENKPSRKVFAIPTYPGVEPFQSDSPDLSNLAPPFGKILRVFKTKDGSPLPKEEVIKFYEDYYEEREWKERTWVRQGSEPYLGLSVSISEREGTDANIQCAGDFYLWLAPKEGMYTIFMNQWRNSSLKKGSRLFYAKIESELKKAAQQIKYSVSLSNTYPFWEEYYENEYLVDYQLFLLSKPDRVHNDMGEGWFGVTLLAYRDPGEAEAQAKSIPKADRQKFIIQKGNILVIVDNSDKSQNGFVAAIAKKLEALENK